MDHAFAPGSMNDLRHMIACTRVRQQCNERLPAVIRTSSWSFGTSGYREDSDYFYAVRLLVSHWRDTHVVDDPDSVPWRDVTLKTSNRFLNEFDVGYRSRRTHGLPDDFAEQFDVGMRATLDLPHSILVLLARRWLSVIYVFAVLIILSAMLLASQGVLSVRWKLLGITLGVHALLIVGSSPSAGTSVQARTGQEVA